MNDQPMNDTELDARIRALVADAVAETPPAPPMPSLDSPMAPVVQLRRTGRSWGMVAAATGVAAALIAAVVWMSQDRDRTITPASTTAAPTPAGGWPADVAVIVADGSERVQRVTASWGEDGALGYIDPDPVSLAFELADGTLLTDADAADGVLLDVGGDGEVLRLVAEPFGGGSHLQATSLDGQSWDLGGSSGPASVAWDRCTFDGDTAFRCYGGDPWIMGGDNPLPEVNGALPAAFTWSGDALVVVVGNEIRRLSVDGSVAETTYLLPEATGWTYVDASDDVAVLSRDDGPGLLYDFRTQTAFPLPVDGRATISFNANLAALPETIMWPQDLAAIISSERGIERVTAEDNEAVVTRLGDPLLGDVAFQIESGSIISQEGLIDVGLRGDRLVQNGGTVTAIDATGIEQVVGSSFQRLTHGLDIYVGQTSSDDGVNWTPFLMTIGDGTQQPEFWAELGVAGPHSSAGDPPRLFSVSPTGSTIGWVHSDLFVLDDGRSFPIPDGSKVWEVDLTDNFVALTRAEGPGSIIDLRTGVAYPAPAAGRLTISLAPVGTSTTSTTTPNTTTPVVTPEPVEVNSTVVTAGPDGVWRVVDGVATQITTEAMSAALALPDGSVIMQPSSGWTFEGDIADTTLRVWRNGEVDPLFPGEAPTGWVRLYDVAMVNGEMTVLYAVEQEAQPQSVLVESVLLTRSLATFETTVIDAEFGGWEQGYSRMHLAENGLIVGEYYQEVVRQFVSYSEVSQPGISAADLGLESSYTDCSDCPRLYTVSRDGSRLAWLDGTMLRLATPGLTAEEQFDLGDVALQATDLELGNGFVVLSFGWGDPGAQPPVVIDFNVGAASAVELPGIRAAIVTVPTAPWELDPDLTAALQGQSFGSQDELYAAVEAQIEAIRYAAVDPVEPITFTRFVLPDGSLAIAAPNFDDSIPESWYRIVLSATGPFMVDRIEFVDVCRDFTYSTPTHLCV
jgi:hypothetical protein